MNEATTTLTRAGVHQSLGSGNVSAFTISRLTRRETTDLVHQSLRDPAVPNSTVRDIVIKSEGIPLFAEELARGVDESEEYLKDPTAVGRHSISAGKVPAVLHGTLMMRLDRAPEARNVAQRAAVIGREFSYQMLSWICRVNRTELDVALSHLENGDVIRKMEDGPEIRYAFKHALVRDAAYEALPTAVQRAVHAEIGEAIEKNSPDTVANQPELLAHHYQLAGNMNVALKFWEQGGKLARSRFANLEASHQFRNALDCIAMLPETPQRDDKELDIQLARGVCCATALGYYADETKQAYERAQAICKDLPNSGKALKARFGLWAHYWMRGEHVQASRLVDDFFSSSRDENDPEAMVVSNRVTGCTLFTLGEFSRARPALENAIQITKNSGLAKLASSYTVEPRIAAQLMLSWDLWFLGFPKAALQNVEDALEVATQHEDPYSIAFAQYVVSVIHFLRGSMQLSLKYAELSHSVSTDYKINLYAIYSKFGRGCAKAALGDHQTAMADITKGIEDAKTYGLGYMRAFMLSRLAVVQKQTGDPDSAMVTLDEAGKFIGIVAGRAWESEIVRLRGEFIIASDPQATVEAERQYVEAIAIARRQEARSLELRAAISLARLRQSQGKFRLAHEELSSSYGWFSEGFETADLQEGQKLIADLV